MIWQQQQIRIAVVHGIFCTLSIIHSSSTATADNRFPRQYYGINPAAQRNQVAAGQSAKYVPITVGNFQRNPNGAHGIVTLIDDKNIQIAQFYFNGRKQAGSFFVLGRGAACFGDVDSGTDLDDSEILLLPDEKGSCDGLGEYQKKNVTITIPGVKTIRDYPCFGIFGRLERKMLARVIIPRYFRLNQGSPAPGTSECPNLIDMEIKDVEDEEQSKHRAKVQVQTAAELVSMAQTIGTILEDLIDAL